MIVAGFGCRHAASEASLRSALTLAQKGLPAVTHLATIPAKAAALLPLARSLGLPMIEIDADTLRQVDTLSCSEASKAAHGTGSVAEAVALVAAGGGAHLLASRQISQDRMATCAIARGPRT